VTADLVRVRVLCDGQAAADHERSWAWHQSISDPAHLAAARAIRRQRVTAQRPAAEPDVQIRPLSDYDAALGTGGSHGVIAAKTAARDTAAEISILTRALKGNPVRLCNRIPVQRRWILVMRGPDRKGEK
jgi:hypothetical protein